MTKFERAPTNAEVVVPLLTLARGVAEPVTHVRSTLIAASLLSLKSLGHLDRYLTHLPVAFHDTVLHTVAGMWLPVEVGVAHYSAADKLGLTVEEQLAMGREVADKIQKSVLGTLVRLAKGVGVTPWTGLEYMPKLWGRVMMGGGMALYRLGPKEARVECHGARQLAELSYFRNGFRGMFQGSGQLFCNKLYVTDLRAFVGKGVAGFQMSWV